MIKAAPVFKLDSLTNLLRVKIRSNVKSIYFYKKAGVKTYAPAS